MSIVYIDKLSVYSFFSFVLNRVNYSHIFYFDTSSNAKRLAKIFKRLGIIKILPQLVDFRVAELRDDKGECQFIRIQEDIRELCLEISDKELANNDFLKGFCQDFDLKKIILFFAKALACEIHDTVVFVNAANWHARNQLHRADKPIMFFLEKGLWSRYLSQYASRFGIKVVEYNTIVKSSTLFYLIKGMNAMILAIYKKLSALRKVSSEKHLRKDTGIAVGQDDGLPLLASWYTGRIITFDLDKRSEFFWLLKSDIPNEQVMLYVERKDVPVLQDDLDVLKKKGIKVRFLTRPITQFAQPVWQPTALYRRLRRHFSSKVIKDFFVCGIGKLKRVPLFYLFRMLSYIRGYSYWYDFFRFHNIKVNVNADTFSAQHIPQNAALEKLGGISIAYQFSNFWFSSILSSCYVDVMFSFSPSYQWVWEKNRSLIGNYVSCGYITDYLFKEVRKNALALKQNMLDKGAQFVICFFDENSSDSRMSGLPNARSVRTYKYLLERVLEDKTLGLIVKPGYPKTLFKRLAPISTLIGQAKASGRCVFLDEGAYLTEKTPSEAAQAADVCLGLLAGGTVALESYLSGRPTVFLDLERLYSHPVYQWGRGKVVFDNLDELFCAIQRFRTDPASIPGFGDLSLWVKDKDPFKDGNASVRIGQYLNWLLEAFRQGKTRDEAIRYANQKYAKAWGLAENNFAYNTVVTSDEIT